MTNLAIIVPCRLESTRFPRKLLHDVRGKPLVLWVAERLSQVAPDMPLWFAVDDPLLRDPLSSAGFQVLMTSRDHATGTDRLAEANRRVGAQLVINVQADEPLVTGAQIRMLAELVAGRVPMATLATRFRKAADFLNPNQVKVVFRDDGRALYFSRAPMPFARGVRGAIDDAWLAEHPCYKHLGLYAYHSDFLDTYVRLPPGRLEQVEKLEQLRALESGHDIAVGVTEDPSIGVDTPEDAEKFERWLGT